MNVLPNFHLISSELWRTWKSLLHPLHTPRAVFSSPHLNFIWLPYLITYILVELMHILYMYVCFCCLRCCLICADVHGSSRFSPVFFVSLLCARMACSHVCSAQGLLHPNGMVKRVREKFWVSCGPRRLWQLCLTLSLEQRGCSRFFLFQITPSYASVTFCSLFDKNSVLYSARTGKRLKDRCYQGHVMKEKRNFAVWSEFS